MNDENSYFICVDVETAGPNPGIYALLSIGAAAVESGENFYIELQPDKTGFTDESMGIHGLKLETLAKSGKPMKEALQAFADWVVDQADGKQPIFVAFNAPFDWMFVNDYLQRYLGENPFGHRALDMKALFMGLAGVAWEETTYQNVASHYEQPPALEHNALKDAVQGAELFAAMLADLKEKQP